MLTREQIEAMDDDAVDEYIATKIFGLHWVGVDGQDDWGRWEGDESTYPKEVGWHDGVTWTPAGCLDDAVEAAEKVGLFVRLENEAEHYWGKKWICMVGNHPGIAPTPALAVCRAVIAAHEK